MSKGYLTRKHVKKAYRRGWFHGFGYGCMIAAIFILSYILKTRGF